MPGAVWVLAEVDQDGALTRLSGEAATAARALAAANGRAVAGIVVAPEPARAAADLAAYLPSVVAVTAPEAVSAPWAAIAASRIAALAAAATEPPSYLVAPHTPEGRDLAGMLAARLGLGVLAGAAAVTWSDEAEPAEGAALTSGAAAGPRVEMPVFGGRLITTSGFTSDRGIILLRPSSVAAVAMETPGTVEPAAPGGIEEAPAVRVVERVATQSGTVSIEEARIIVSGGRGVGGPDGFALLRELAALLGGAVGASRAAVDAGWIPYSVQIGQTGKTVRPAVYLALGISGAIQHKVGMQTAETIIAVNRDADAPIAEFADLFVAGDLFEVGAALASALRERGASPRERPA